MLEIANDNEQVKELYNKMDASHEFEIIFHGLDGKTLSLSLKDYITFMKYLSFRNSKDNKLQINDILDVIYSPTHEDAYRCEIIGKDNINNIMRQLTIKKNHVLFRALILTREKTKIQFIHKTKKHDEVIDNKEFNIRFRLSGEDELSISELESLASINETSVNKIKFRLKQRASYYVYNKDDEFVRIDLTLTKMSDSFDKLNKSVPNYELEIEYGTKNKPTNEKCLNIMYNELTRSFQVLQQNRFITPLTVKNSVINGLCEKFGVTFINTLDDIARKPVSLEIQHVTEQLANKYLVTDKADGERIFLYIYDNKVYFITTGMDVKFSGIKTKLEKYNGTIMDGELLLVSKKYLLLIFDCLFIGSEDVRKLPLIQERIKKAEELIEKLFIFKEHTKINYDIDVTENKFDLKNILTLHKNNIKNYIDAINHDVKINDNLPVIRRKYFMSALGAKNNEIFAYCNLLWNIYSNDTSIRYPYLLDGMIFHPLDQAYIANAKESKKLEYKWKPSEKNSIDFYVTFERDKTTGRILTVYDNTTDNITEGEALGKNYYICNLHVGIANDDGSERPVLFHENEELYKAYLFIDKGEVRDLDGNIINDNTVVEFYYNNDDNVSKEYRWVPMRTRYDKTDVVVRYHQKYGNFITVAEKVWRSIVKPITLFDFEELSKENKYDKKIEEMRSKIEHKIIASTAQEDAYYQVTKKITKDMDNFHNYVKSNLIYTYIYQKYRKNKKASVLDIGTGRGGDLMKYYYCNIDFLVGIDKDKTNLINAVDGALSRYKRFKQNNPAFPRMYFIQADPTTLLNFDEQNTILGGTDLDNKRLIEKFFSIDESKRTKFDVITSMFSMHYYLRNDDSWNNFKRNLNMYLNDNGLFVITVSDARKIIKLIGDKPNYKAEYTDENGNKQVLFEIVKKYDVNENTKVIKTGQPVDFHMAWISSANDTYLTEYLVDQNFIVDDLMNSCGLELIDTESFDNLFYKYKNYFENYAQYEDNPQTLKFLMNVKKYYNPNDINKECYPFTGIERFYAFRKSGNVKDVKEKSEKNKKEKNEKNEKKKKSKQKGGRGKMLVGNLDKYDPNYSFLNSIHHILISQKIIPKSETMEEVFNSRNIRVKLDKQIKQSYIKSVGDNFVELHQTEKELEKVIDGLDIVIAEKNCNDEFDIEHSNKKIKKKLVLLKNDNSYLPVYSQDYKGIFNNEDLEELFYDSSDNISSDNE
jgi:hypothetical protein